MKGVKGVVIGILACLLVVRELNHRSAIAAEQENTRSFGQSQLEAGHAQGKKEAELALKEMYLAKLDSVRKVQDQALASLRTVYKLAIDSCNEENQKLKKEWSLLKENHKLALDSNQILRGQVKQLKIQLEKRIKANTQARGRPSAKTVSSTFLKAAIHQVNRHQHDLAFLSCTFQYLLVCFLLLLPIALGLMRLMARRKLSTRLRKSFLR